MSKKGVLACGHKTATSHEKKVLRCIQHTFLYSNIIHTLEVSFLKLGKLEKIVQQSGLARVGCLIGQTPRTDGYSVSTPTLRQHVFGKKRKECFNKTSSELHPTSSRNGKTIKTDNIVKESESSVHDHVRETNFRKFGKNHMHVRHETVKNKFCPFLTIDIHQRKTLSSKLWSRRKMFCTIFLVKRHSKVHRERQQQLAIKNVL